MNRTFQTEFPDFPVEDMPAIPAGFEDQSWCVDACPTFYNERLDLWLYIDYFELSKRRNEGLPIPRFSLQTEEDGVIDTDEWDALVDAIAEFAAR